MAPLLFPADVCHLGAQIGFTLGGLYGIIPCRKLDRGRGGKYFRSARRLKSRLRDVPTAGVVNHCRKLGRGRRGKYFRPARRLKSRLRDVPTAGVVE